MINGSESARILNAELNTAWVNDTQSSTPGAKKNPSNGTGFFPVRMFQAFLTAAPTVNASGSVTAYTEPTGGDYHRAELTELGPQGSRILAQAEMIEQKIGLYEDEEHPDTVTSTITRMVAKVTNKNENIFFPYTGESGSGYSAPITHFGIFTAETGGTPIFYGPLESSVTVGANVVPIVLKGKLQVTLG